MRSIKRISVLTACVLTATVMALGVASLDVTASSKKKDGAVKETAEKAPSGREESEQGGAKASQSAGAESIEKGDIVLIHYAATLEDGSLYETTLEKRAKDPGSKKASWYVEPKSFSPVLTVAGERGPAPGIGDALLGMKAGERKTVSLPAEKAYGPANPSNKLQYACAKKIPKIMVMDPEQYVKQFGAFPVVGNEVEATPYFKAKILEVSETSAKLEMLAVDGIKEEESFGTAEIHVQGEEITISLAPKIGAPFEADGRKGIIESSDGKNFTVDFNSPLLGKAISLDLEAVSVTKASGLSGVSLDWLQDHDKGIGVSKESGKPCVLVLYAGWCKWSKKLLDESFNDPRIRMLKDKFVWVKVDSDSQKKYKEQYSQQGFPLVVLLSPNGKPEEKVEGFTDAQSLYSSLSDFLKNMDGRS